MESALWLNLGVFPTPPYLQMCHTQNLVSNWSTPQPCKELRRRPHLFLVGTPTYPGGGPDSNCFMVLRVILMSLCGWIEFPPLPIPRRTRSAGTSEASGSWDPPTPCEAPFSSVREAKRTHIPESLRSITHIGWYLPIDTINPTGWRWKYRPI